MKIVKTEDKTVRFQNYTIDYENEIICYVKMRNTSIRYEFEKNKKRLQYVSDIQPLINSHWSDHHRCFKLKKFTLNELKNFKEFDKLFYVGGILDGMLLDHNLKPLSSVIILDNLFFSIWEKIETSKEECEKILKSLNKKYILKSRIDEIPYYNQNDYSNDHYTLYMEVLLSQNAFVKCFGDAKHLSDIEKKKIFEFLKKDKS